MPRQVVDYIIENFQSHVKTVVKPAPGGQVTTIVGPSRNGKSAIFRALRKLYYNQPEGTGFIRIGADWCRITAVFDDGYRVIYYRTRGGISRYTVLDPTGAKQEYNDGKSVPLEVQEILLVRPVTVGDMTLNLNLAEQLDGPFLGTKSISAPARAKIIGKLAGTEEMDYASKQLGTDVYRAKQEETRLTNLAKNQREKLEGYDYLEELGDRIASLYQIRDEVEQLIVRRNRLRELATQRDVLTVKLRAEQETIVNTAFIGPLSEQVTVLEMEIAKASNLQRLITERKSLQASIDTAQQVIQATQAIREAESFTKQAEQTLVTRVELASLQSRKSAIENLMKANNEIFLEALPATEAENLIIQALAALERRIKLGRLYSFRKDLLRKLQESTIVLNETQGLFEAESLLTQAKEQISTKVTLSKILNARNHFTTLVESNESQVRALSKVLEQTYKDYHGCLLQVGRCPTCGSQVTDVEMVKEVV